MALQSTNDAKYNALRAKGYSGSADDMFKQHMQVVTTSRIASERDYWLVLYPTGTGTLNDIKFNYFGSLGYAGDIQTRENLYWSNVVL